MKQNLFFKSFLILLLMLNINLTFGQNKYLSFTEGITENVTDQKTLPNRTFTNMKEAGVEIAYRFTGAGVSEKQVEKTTYNYLHIEGFAKMTIIGAPALPAHTEIIAIPRGATGRIVILKAEYKEYDGYMVHPALAPARDTEGVPSPKFQKDDKIYSVNEFFPKNIVEITNTGESRGTPLVFSEVRPVQFNPVTGKIRVYTNIEYKLIPQGGEADFDYIARENTLHYTNLLKRNIINSESIPDGISSDNQKKNKEGEKNYIIITHSEYLTQANQLANWKRQLGYSVEVVSQASWTAAQVNTEVHNRYNTWTPKPDYFVIIGDHTGSYAVPGEICQAPSSDNFATDLYVACMDGGSDHIPDMAHGRISVSSATEAQVVIDKIINYEQTPTTQASFYTNILNCAQYQDSDDNNGYADRRFCHTSEEIRDYLQGNYSYTSTRVYQTSSTWDVTDLHYNNGYFSDGQLLPAELRNASFNWNGGSSDITSAVNAGKFMVFHRDHGYVGGSGWAHPYYTTTSMNSLTNGDKLPVVFSINCHTGEFQLSNCFAEKFIRMENKGAVGVVAAAYYSYSGYNDALSEGMIDAIWSNPGIHPDFGTAGNGGSYTIGPGNDIYTMGDVVNQGLYAMVQNYSNSAYTHELFHWFGDPAMKIWTANPNSNVITATHDATINCENSSFSITGSTYNATATLVYNDELISTTVLNGSGNGTLSYSISQSGGTVKLTISKHNNKPYTVNLNVTGNCYYLPAPENFVGTLNSNDADLSWDTPSTPNTAGVISYTDIGSITSYVGTYTIKGTMFQSDAGFNFPVTVTKLSHGFYEPATWIDATFRFRIYSEDFSTIFYESPDIEAVHYTEIEHILNDPIILTSDFFVAVVTTDASGEPHSLLETVPTGTAHGYVSDGTTWYFADTGSEGWEFLTSITIVNAKGEQKVSYANNENYTNNFNLDLLPKDTKIYSITNPNTGAKSALTGYQVYKDGTAVGSVLPATQLTYTDADICGSYDYYVTALYTGYTGESDASNTETVENPLPAAPTNVSATSTTICLGENSTLYYTGGSGDTFEWYTGSCGGTSVGTGNNLSVSPTSTTTYYGRWENDCGNSSCESVIITVNTDPVAPISVSATETEICPGESTILSYTGGSGTTFAWYTSSCGGTSVGTGNNLFVSPVTTTTYYGRWENDCGNSSCESVIITVNTDPVAPISVSATETGICPGESTSLSYIGGSGTTFAWYTSSCGGTLVGTGNNLSVSPTSTTTYYGRWENSYGDSYCESITVSVGTITNITCHPNDVTADVGNNVTFMVVAAGDNLAYQWRKNSSDISGENQASYTINNVQLTDAGNYDVAVSGDCGTETSNIAVLDVNSGITELEEYGIEIYPNPASDNITISFENIKSEVKIEILNMTGQVVLSETCNNLEYSIDLGDFEKGIYLIMLNFDNNSVKSKLIIQ